jgi:hypothetical protein
MQLHEILKQEGVDAVSAKTNLSLDILNNLESENFEKLNRVKTLGFLLILEREYKDIDVSGIRERAKLYFEEHKPVDEKVVVLSHDRRAGEGFSFFKWFMILGLLLGAWYLYNHGKLDVLLKNVKEEEDFFDDKKALENNVSLEDAKKIMIANTEIQSVKVDNLVAPVAKESIPLTNDEKVVEPPVEKKIIVIDTQKKTLESVAKAENIEEESKPVEETVEKIVKVKPIETVIEVKKEEPKLVIREEVKEDYNNLVSGSTITINPTRGMLWYGFINIDTGVKKEFMKKVSTPFEIQSGRWLLVTGHGFVDIVSEFQTVEVADSQKHYFYIDSNEIRELSKDEFRDMNGRRGW